LCVKLVVLGRSNSEELLQEASRERLSLKIFQVPTQHQLQR
jgi:hypothetical protein